jgi:hypothetical protein
MNILSWNARCMWATTKMRILHDIIVDYKVDIIAIQWTKKVIFHLECLKELIHILTFG